MSVLKVRYKSKCGDLMNVLAVEHIYNFIYNVQPLDNASGSFSYANFFFTFIFLIMSSDVHRLCIHMLPQGPK